MENYSFTLWVKGLDPNEQDYEKRLYDAGCDDALVCVIDGMICVDFDRAAQSREQAVAAAQADINRAGGVVDRITQLGPMDVAPAIGSRRPQG
jgi:hypothetical protein